MDKDERALAIKGMIADPDKLRREIKDRARRDNPALTEDQLEAMWQQAAHQLGL